MCVCVCMCVCVRVRRGYVFRDAEGRLAAHGDVRAVLQGFFPGLVHEVLVLRPAGFFQRAFTDVGYKFVKDDFKFPVSRAGGHVVTSRAGHVSSRVILQCARVFAMACMTQGGQLR